VELNQTPGGCLTEQVQDGRGSVGCGFSMEPVPDSGLGFPCDASTLSLHGSRGRDLSLQLQLPAT